MGTVGEIVMSHTRNRDVRGRMSLALH